MPEPRRKSKPFRTLSSRIAWSCPWYDVRQDEIENAQGVRGQYNVVQKPAAVFVLPVTGDGRVVLIRTYRYTVDDWCLEVPAGRPKPHESLEEGARSELREEVGGTARALDYVAWFYSLNGITNEVCHVFLASDVTLGATEHEPFEAIEPVPLAIAEALDLARRGEIRDGPSALALLLCEPRLVELARATR
jgi:ADP-ribose pyrophosphatase